MIACRTQSEEKRLNIQIDNEKIADISAIWYLERKIARNDRCNADIRSKIGQAKNVLA